MESELISSNSTDGMSLVGDSDKNAVKIFLILAALPSILGAIVALFAPNNILHLLPILMPGVDFMTSQLSFMSERIAASSIPQVLALTYLIGFTFLPLQMVLLTYCYFKYVNAWVGFKRLRYLGYKRWKMRLIIYLSMPLLAFAMTLNGNYHYLGIDPVNTRIGLVIVAVFGLVGWNLIWIQAIALTFMNNSDWDD